MWLGDHGAIFARQVRRNIPLLSLHQKERCLLAKIYPRKRPCRANKSTASKRCGKNWLQPLRAWILDTKKAKNLASSENYGEMKRFVQKVGTNPKFLDKSISFSFCPPWDFMALRKAQSPNAERRSREAILSQNGESCDWCICLTKSEPFLNGTDGALRAPN